MADMGLVVKDGKVEKAPEPAPKPANGKDDLPVGTTMGEIARWKKEREELANTAAPPEQKPAEQSAAPAPPAAQPATPPGPAAPVKAKIEVEKGKPIEEIVEGIVKKLTTQPPPAEPKPAAPAQPAAADPDAAFIDTLDEAEKEEIDLARYAAKAMPDKYGTMPKRMVEYLKQVHKFVEDKFKEDPDWNSDSDDGYQAFIEDNRPEYHGRDKKILERSQIAEDVESRVTQKFQPKIEEANKIARAQELKPELDQAVDSYRQRVFQSMAPDEKSPFHAVVTKAGQAGWEEAAKVDRLAASIAQKHADNAVALGREYLEIASGVKDQVPYKPDLPLNHRQNQDALRQAQLFAYIERQEDVFYQNGGNYRVSPDGKTFVPRREFVKMPEAERSKHWTLTHTMAMDVINDGEAANAMAELESELKRRAEEGFVRQTAAPAPKTETPAPAPAPVAGESPRATVTSAPGTAIPSPAAPGPTILSKSDLERLWTPGAKSWAG